MVMRNEVHNAFMKQIGVKNDRDQDSAVKSNKLKTSDHIPEEEAIMLVAKDVHKAIVAVGLYDPADGEPSLESVYKAILSLYQSVAVTKQPASSSIVTAYIDNDGDLAYSMKIGSLRGPFGK